MLRKGIQWITGNRETINFWYDNWMEDSPLVNKIQLNNENLVNSQARVSDFISSNKHWYLLLIILFEKFIIPILVCHIEDKMFWEFTCDDSFLIKTTWANNDSIKPHPKAKFINSIWRLNLIPKIKIFARKLIRNILPTRDRLIRFGININCDSPFYNKETKTLNHIFVHCDLAYNILLLPDPNSYCQNFIDWLESIWIQNNWYSKVFSNP